MKVLGHADGMTDATGDDKEGVLTLVKKDEAGLAVGALIARELGMLIGSVVGVMTERELTVGRIPPRGADGKLENTPVLIETPSVTDRLFEIDKVGEPGPEAEVTPTALVATELLDTPAEPPPSGKPMLGAEIVGTSEIGKLFEIDKIGEPDAKAEVMAAAWEDKIAEPDTRAEVTAAAWEVAPEMLATPAEPALSDKPMLGAEMAGTSVDGKLFESDKISEVPPAALPLVIPA